MMLSHSQPYPEVKPSMARFCHTMAKCKCTIPCTTWVSAEIFAGVNGPFKKWNEKPKLSKYHHTKYDIYYNNSAQGNHASFCHVKIVNLL